ncbi:MAG: UbiA family prenyltransferase [Thermoplasmata archaeon]
MDENLISAGFMGIFIPALILSFIIGFRMVFKEGILRSLIFSSAAVFLSLPVFVVRRVSLVGVPYRFKLYETFSLDLFFQSGWTQGLLVNQKYHLLIVLLLMEVFIVYFLCGYKFFYKKFKNILRTIKPFRTLHFIMMVLLGAIFVGEFAPEESLSLTSINHFPFVFTAAFCGVLAWQFTTLLNDIYDMDIDVHVHPTRPLVSGHLSRRLYLDISIFTALLSTLFSLLLGIPIMLFNITALLLAVLYSVPPFRLRDRFYGHICVGLGSLIAFLFGVYSPTRWRHGIYTSSEITGRNIPFFPEVFFVSILIVTVLSISPLINALSDYEGDKSSGVKNVYTVLGFERGKKVVSVLIILLFISPLVLFSSLIDMVILFAAGVISSIIFYRFEDHRPVFGMYFLVLIYLLLRFISYL